MKKPFKETAVGKFLSKNAPGVLEVVGDVFPPAKLISNLFEKEAPQMAPEQTLEFQKLLLEYEQNDLKAYLADVADARDMNIKIQEAAAASWLAKNVGFMIDLLIVACTIGLVLLLYFVPIPDGNREIAYAVLGVLLTGLNTVLNFYRGSSKGSADKTDVLIKSLKTHEKTDKG
jgi:hypothetical protein